MKNCAIVIPVYRELNAYEKFSYDVLKSVVKDKDIYVVSLKGPMDQSLFKNLKNYMCLYEYTPNSIRAIVKYLNNEIKVEGKLPYGD